MTCRVMLFARARDLAGAAEVIATVGESATVADLRHSLAAACPRLASLLERCAVAVDGEFAREDTRISPDQEIALLPPVSGGQDAQ